MHIYASNTGLFIHFHYKKKTKSLHLPEVIKVQIANWQNDPLLNFICKYLMRFSKVWQSMTSSDPARLFVPVWNYTSSSPMLYFLELSCLRGFSTLTFDLGHRLHRKRQGFTSDGFTWKALHLELNHVYMVLLAL